MSFLARFQRKKEDPEISRRARLLLGGRIGDAVVLETSKNEGLITVFYRYNIAGVEYESSQLLDSEQSGREQQYLPGARVTLRFDPHWPGNSVVV